MDPYKILNIPRDAKPEEIRKAYRKAATKHHPDMGGEAWVFQQIQESYDLIVNPKPKKKRAEGKTKRSSQGTQQERGSKPKPDSHSKSNKSNSQHGPSQKARQGRKYTQSQLEKAKRQHSESNGSPRNSRMEQQSRVNRSTLPPKTCVRDTGQNQPKIRRKAEGADRSNTRASSILRMLLAFLTLFTFAAITLYCKSYYLNTMAISHSNIEDRNSEPIAPAGEYQKLKESIETATRQPENRKPKPVITAPTTSSSDWKLLKTISSPLKGNIKSIAVSGDEIFLVQYDSIIEESGTSYLVKLDASSGDLLFKIRLPGLINGICTDGNFVYAADYQLGSENPLLVYNKSSGKLVRHLFIEGYPHRGTFGIAYHDGMLYLLNNSGKVEKVDQSSGKIVGKIRGRVQQTRGLYHDGQIFATKSKSKVEVFGPDGRVIENISPNTRLTCVAFDKTEIFGAAGKKVYRFKSAFWEARFRSSTNPAKRKTPDSIDHVQWVTSFEKAKELSKEHGRPILAYCSYDGELPSKSSKFYPSLNGVAKKLEEFICVNGDCVKRSSAKRFNITGWPTVLVLGLEEENVFRFMHSRSSPAFAANLNKSLENYAMYSAGKDWNPNSAARPTPEWEENQLVRRIKAPLGGRVRGIAQVGNELIIAQYKESSGMTGFLFRLDAQTGETITKTPLPSGSFIIDICADEQFIYGADYGWTAGDPIYILDRFSGKLVRKVVTKENAKQPGHGTRGIAWHDGKLFMSSTHGISTVDPSDGRILSSLRPTGSPRGFDFNGQHFLRGGYNGFHFLDLRGGQLETFKTPGKLQSVAFHEENILCAYDQDYGFDKHHNRIRTGPEKVEIYTVRNPFFGLRSDPKSREPESGH